MNAAATTTAEPATLPPDDQAVLDWCKIRLSDLHARSGIDCIQLAVIRYDHSGEIGAHWFLHKDGECVSGQPSIAEGVKALREKLEARS